MEEVLKNYGEVLVWCPQNEPIIYNVVLVKVDSSYHLTIEAIRGTNPLGLLEGELLELKKVLHLENKSFGRIEPRRISTGGRNIFTIEIK